MWEFYIAKVHSWELFLIFIENLFLIFWSDFSLFCVFLSENRSFERKKTEALASVSPVYCIQLSMSLLLHPIKYLIRDFKADLCLLLGRQGVAGVLQCGEACVF